MAIQEPATISEVFAVKPFVYLAGQITGLSYDGGQNWRLEAAELLASYGIDSRSPLRCKEFLRDIGVLNDNHDFHPLSADAGIVARDRNDVMTCGAVLMNLLGTTKISVGTMIEVGWADAFRKPVVLVMESGNVHSHPMVRGMVGYRVETIKEGIAIAATILGASHV